MLYMNILTWDPDKRDEVIKRVEKQGLSHEGIKVIGSWVEFTGARAFQLTEEPSDPKYSIKANFTWNDLVKIESIPIIEAEEMLKILKGLK